MDTASFEYAYIERTRKTLQAAGKINRIERILLTREPVPAGVDPNSTLGGWWCDPERTTLGACLPNPWDDRSAIAVFDAYCHTLASWLTDRLAPQLNGIHGTSHSREYWDLMLGPWLQLAVPTVIDRRLFCVTAHAVAPNAHFLTGPEVQPPPTMSSAVDGYGSDEGNLRLMTAIVRALALEEARASTVSHVPLASSDAHRDEARPPTLPSRLASLLRMRPSVLLRTLNTVLAQRFFARQRGRRVALVGQINMSLSDMVSLWRRVPGMRLARSETPQLRAGQPAPSAANVARKPLGEIEFSDPIERLITTLLPKLTPRTLIEEYPSVVAESERAYGKASHVVVGNYSIDEVQNEFIARSSEAGKGVAFAQHGGSYGQARIHPAERLELRRGSVFASWGEWQKESVRPTPSPYINRLHNKHQGGRKVVIVESLSSRFPYPIRFESSPLGAQTYEVDAQVRAFIETITAPEVRRSVVLKRFPIFSNFTRDEALERLPHRLPRNPPLATDWFRVARIAIVTYPDTPLIEAIVMNVPTIALWNPDHWEMRDDAAPHFAALVEAGIVHYEPKGAAAKLESVYATADEWWRGSEIQEARQQFLERFAKPGDWVAAWAELLREVAEPPNEPPSRHDRTA